MEKESTDFSLIDLYCYSEMFTFFRTSLSSLNEESEIWNSVLHSHIDQVLQSETQFLKIENLGADLDWLNTTKPLTLDEELKDRIIVLDFFTYCCVNCEHALPYIKEVEVVFENNPELLVIGVHSPKFPNEKAKDSVKHAIIRNDITHPVINDPENSLWNKLGVSCWPTILILSPNHRVLFSVVGEAQIEKLSYICYQTIEYFKMHSITLNEHPLCLATPDDICSIDNTLLYPGGISTEGTFIMVSDTGHNRLLLLSIDGEVLDIIGSGVSGYCDGSFASSAFNRPQGTAWWKTNFVFVADTGNRSIRMINLKSRSVSTIFNGNLLDTESDDYVEFSSPWDLCLGPEFGTYFSELNVLYIAVAGSHQIWNVNLEPSKFALKRCSSLKCTPFAGNGTEECRNSYLKMNAGFAQPSGICYSKLYPDTLFIADSESSAVRTISLVNGAVKTIIGGAFDPKNLFQYGDKDGLGPGLAVKLQHPIGICVMEIDECDPRIGITDTYNHKLKLIVPEMKYCSTVAGRGTRGRNCKRSALESEFNEPSGICYSALLEAFLIVDTNNHCIKIYEIKTEVLKFLDVKLPNSCCIDGPKNSSPIVSTNSKGSSRVLVRQDKKCIKIDLAYGGKINCTFKLNQNGVSLTDGTLQPWNLSFTGHCNWKVASNSPSLFDPSNQPSLVLECSDSDTEVRNCEVIISSDLTLCDNINNTCFPKKFVKKLDIMLSSSGSDSYDAVFIF